MASKTALRLTVPAAALALVLSACSGSAPSDDATQADLETAAAAADPEDTIEAREDNFKAIAKSMKAVKGQLDSDSPDFAVISENAAEMAANAKKVPDFFPAGTGPDSGEDTEALATIWERPEEFQAAAAKLITATDNLNTAAGAQDLAAVKTAFGETGMACKGCHDDFRMKKKD